MLKEFGLSGNEALIYTYLLERGVEVGGSKIAVGTSLHRQYIYLGLAKLIGLGLIEAVAHGKQKKYKAVAPSQIEKIAKKRLFAAEDTVRELNTFSVVGHEQDFEILQGALAIQRYEMVYAERAEPGSEEYIIGGNEHGFEEVMGTELDEYTSIKDAKKMRVLYIGGKSVETERYKGQTSFTARILPKFPSGETHVVIRADTVLFFSFLTPPLVYVIKSPVVAENYKQFFLMLWDMASSER